MRSRKAYCEKLGITQQEMAWVLSISRSTWSMFVLGRRDIPTASMVLLLEMLAHVEKQSTEHSKNSPTTNWQSIGKHIEKKHREITCEHLAVSLDKNAVIKNERAVNRNFSRQFLEQMHKIDPQNRFGKIAPLLKSNPEKQEQALFDHAFRQATLDFQRQWLEAQLKQ